MAELDVEAAVPPPPAPENMRDGVAVVCVAFIANAFTHLIDCFGNNM